jgi:hypothetical protein
MHLKTFTKNYQLYLLPVSHSGIQLGNLVWKPFWSAPKLSHPGMPNHLSNAFYDIGILNQSSWKQWMKRFDQPLCENAELAKIKIKKASRAAGALLDALGLDYEKAYVLQAEISDLCAKVMDNALRVELDRYLEQLNQKSLRDLFRNPRKVYLITELYYGSFKLRVEKQHEFTVEQQIKANKWPLEIQLDSDSEHFYAFTPNELPFAYKMERILGFNG